MFNPSGGGGPCLVHLEVVGLVSPGEGGGPCLVHLEEVVSV